MARFQILSVTLLQRILILDVGHICLVKSKYTGPHSNGVPDWWALVWPIWWPRIVPFGEIHYFCVYTFCFVCSWLLLLTS